MGKDEKKIARIEMDAALSGLWALGDRCYWVSHPIALRTAENKPLQLVRAAQLGLEVPRTLISNRPNEIREFCARCQGRIVYKTMGQHILVENIPTEGESPGKDVSRTPLYRHFHTSLLTEESLNANIDTLSGIPLIFQEYVDKCYEYRVTIIGNDIFVAEIDSQSQERTRIDWRHYDVPARFRKGVLPSHVLDACLALTKGFGLNFGAIDLILTPDGRYVFLEINSNGQWAFVETLVPELKMTDSMVNALLNRP